ncbi:MAG: 30S ribosomal protein S2, partial [Mycoplasmataceae bacterium]|nr:30S ribosomal protein S2 [Mycoplasmataceae bacterium]
MSTNTNNANNVTNTNNVSGAKKDEKQIISLNKLLEAGVYFGHKKDKWNPKMKPFIHGVKNGTHIIDVSKTYKALELAFKLLSKAAEKGSTFIFVGTKKQAKETIKEQALRTNSSYVNERWLGGTLTNSKTIFSRIRVMEDLENLESRNFEGYTKKEGILMKKELEKLHKNLNGIRNLQRVPHFMIVADSNEDLIAIKEAKKKNVKVIGIIDTNTDPELVDLGIPA